MAAEQPGSNEHKAADLPTDKARQGVELGVMRYVLSISLGVSVVALVLVYLFV